MYLRRVDMAVARLSKRMRQCIQVKFFSPLKEDGNAFTHRQMALGIGISKDAFEKNVHRGKQKVSRILSKMGVAMS
jgi:DNA-directed RNA polymerase specialized sigma24 family protein